MRRRSIKRGALRAASRALIWLTPNPRVPVFDETTWSARIERLLTHNVIPFWAGRVADPAGGYYERFRVDGPGESDGVKHARTQSRTLWTCSRLLRAGRGWDTIGADADHGFRYLRDRLWDETHSGIATDSGSSSKNMYDHLMLLDALIEYSRARESSEALGLAGEVLDIIRDRFADPGHGYWEDRTTDWGVPSGPGMLVADPDHKSIATHLNALHVLSRAHEAGLADLAGSIGELLDLVDGRALVTNLMGETFTADWSRVIGEPSVGYGHDIERIWIGIAAREAVRAPPGAYQPVLEETVRWAWDRRWGGFFHSGPVNRPAWGRRKQWWVQGEAIVACAHLLPADPERFGGVLEGTLQWIEGHQADHVNGEWHDTIYIDGSIGGSKGGTWKTGYHATRSLLAALDVLQRRG